MKQCTIEKSVSIAGVGLHTGAQVKLVFHPAPENHGYKFKRVDLDGQPVIPADVNLVCATNRGTTLQSAAASISTTEHVLSALFGLGIDNVLMEVDGPEIPIMDGSALPFLEVLRSAGCLEQEEEREYFEITEPFTYRDETTGSELMVVPAADFEVISMIDFNSAFLGQQYASFGSDTDYASDIAPCRTFVFLHELEVLYENNLIRGGDLNNAIVIADRPVSQDRLDALAGKMGVERVTVDKEGVLNTIDLKFKNELARHKLLDIIGDVSLLNVEFTRLLKRKYQEQRKLKGKPTYNPDDTPLLNTIKVAEWLPHRYPFLLVDKIIELSPDHVVGVKNVSFNESFFQGHFPGNPVMPGVLQIEAMAQTGGILALSTVDDPGNWDTYFLKIENAKFKHKVIPGDTVLFKMELMAPIRRGICQMYGTAYVGNKIVSEAELTAQIVKRN